MTKKKELFWLIIIFFLGIIFRFLNLNSIPPGLYPDEAINANEAILNPKKIFYPENNGREGLFINLLWVSFKIFGKNIFALRLVPAFFGLLTLLGFYLFSRQFFNFIDKKNYQVLSLLGTFFVSVSFWHVNFSRIAFRAILLPFVVVFWLYFFFFWLKTKKKFSLFLSSIFLGLGFYTYSSFRLVFLLVLFILFYLLKKEGNFKNFLVLCLEFLLPAFLVALPLGIYFLFHPSDFFGRLGPISIFAQKDIPSSFLKSLTSHLLMFNFKGDPNWRHNVANDPELFWPVGICFLIGFFVFLERAQNLQERKDFDLMFFYLFPFFGFFTFLLPGILTYEGIPHSLRVIGTIPFVYLFASFGALWLYQNLKKLIFKFKIGPLILKTLIVFFFILVVTHEANKYFVFFAKNENVKNAFCKNFVEMGKYLISLDPNLSTFVVVNEDGVPVSWANNTPMPAQTLIFFELSKYGKIKSIYITPKDLQKIEPKQNFVILFMKEDRQLLEFLKEKYPQGQIKINPPIFSFELL